MNPKDIQISEYRHKELPPALLKRIKVTTDTFEIIDEPDYAFDREHIRRALDEYWIA